MTRTFWSGALAAIAACAVVGGSLGYALLRGKPPAETAAAKAKAAPAAPVKTPKAVVDKRDRDLGIIDSVDKLTQVFFVRNEGTAPLELKRGPTSCKCTMSDLPGKPIPPGMQAEVRVASKVADKRGPFSLSATVFTNDPALVSITFKVEGNIRSRVAVQPPQIVFSNVRPGEASSAHAVVYSEVWDQFTIGRVKSSLPGLTWRIAAHKGAKVSDITRCAYDVDVTLPANLIHKDCKEFLDLTIQPANRSEKTEAIKLEVAAHTIDNVVITGEKLVLGEYLRIGKLSRGEGDREILILKINDEHRRLTVRKIVTDPEFLRVKVVPYSASTAKVGLYRIEIEIPQDAPACAYLVGHHAKIKIETDHPVAKSIELEAEFAVL
jgi:hypothetical protein